MGKDPKYNGHPGQVMEVPNEMAEALFADRAAVPIDKKTFHAEVNAGVETAEAPKARIEKRAPRNQA